MERLGGEAAPPLKIFVYPDPYHDDLLEELGPKFRAEFWLTVNGTYSDVGHYVGDYWVHRWLVAGAGRGYVVTDPAKDDPFCVPFLCSSLHPAQHLVSLLAPL